MGGTSFLIFDNYVSIIRLKHREWGISYSQTIRCDRRRSIYVYNTWIRIHIVLHIYIQKTFNRLVLKMIARSYVLSLLCSEDVYRLGGGARITTSNRHVTARAITCSRAPPTTTKSEGDYLSCTLTPPLQRETVFIVFFFSLSHFFFFFQLSPRRNCVRAPLCSDWCFFPLHGYLSFYRLRREYTYNSPSSPVFFFLLSEINNLRPVPSVRGVIKTSVRLYPNRRRRYLHWESVSRSRGGIQGKFWE